ncbi:MAG: penicillin-binding protein 1C [Pseudomonadota bacterium]
MARRLATPAAILLVLLAVFRLWPHAPLSDFAPASTAIHADDGRLLRLTLASDEQYRLWTPLEDVAPEFVQALLLHEDRHFYRHPGVNPAALLRAARETWSGGVRQGGSTITMQLARLMYRLNTRSIGGKLEQIALALWLELRYSKRDLLEAHVNLLPYGSNLQGVGAASRIYFGKAAGQLTLTESLTLVLVPQSPQARDPLRTGHEPDGLRRARERLLATWRVHHPDSGAASVLAAQAPRYAGTKDLPFAAPHLTTWLLMQPDRAREIHSTIDLRLQTLLEAQIARHVQSNRRIGVNNAAALLVDFRSMEVKAVVGSAGFFDAAIQGQVNGTLAKRSPGSALKPFIYALAIDQGLIHPQSVLKDAPTAFGPFSPENFDGAFVGPITVHDALIRSRNVPAVALASRLSQPGFYQFLRTAGIANMASERHYGLALTLGGGEVTMEEVATLYAMLANRGVLQPLRYVRQPRNGKTLSSTAATYGVPGTVAGPRLLSEEASFMVLDMLKDNPPPELPETLRAQQLPVAWKTGTSWGFRDAWTAGVFGPYVLVVWVGNFDGSGNPAFVGVHTAAPLFFRVVDAVKAAKPGLSAPAFRQPEHLARVDVCAASGELPNADCPRVVPAWFIPGKSPIRVSQVHRRLRIDSRTGHQACADTPARYVQEKVYEFWPTDILRLFEQAGIPRRRPPAEGNCGVAANPVSDVRPQITSPLTGVEYPVRAARLGQEVIPLNANADGDVRTLYWFVDDAYVGAGKPGVALPWTPRTAGTFRISAVDEHGRSAARPLRVVVIP